MNRNSVAFIYMVVGLLLMMSHAIATIQPKADWYLHVNLEALENSPLMEIIDKKKERKEAEIFIKKIVGENFNKQVKTITLYGNHEATKKYTAILNGEFTKKSIDKMISGLNSLSASKKIKFHSKNIYYFKVKDIHIDKKNWQINTSKGKAKDTQSDVAKANIELDEEVEVYLTDIDNSKIVVSNDKKELQKWILGKYNLKSIQNNGIFHVVVNLQQAMAHGGLKLGENHINVGFDSSLMKKISQFAFSVGLNKKNAHIEVSLQTIDNEVAQQLKNVVAGLIALKSLASEEDQELQALIRNLNVDSKDNNIIIKSTISTDELKQLAE